MEAGREQESMSEVLQAAGEFGPQQLQRGLTLEL
jgi:hypothetical protein